MDDIILKTASAISMAERGGSLDPNQHLRDTFTNYYAAINSGGPSESLSPDMDVPPEGIEVFGNNNFRLISGSANIPLALDIGRILRKNVDHNRQNFASGEPNIVFEENMRGRPVYIIQPMQTVDANPAKAFVEMIAMIDAARRAAASEIVAVMPLGPYSRQDKKDRPRVPITAAITSQIIEFAGANGIMTMDDHSSQQQGYVRIRSDNLYAMPELIKEVRTFDLSKTILISPDLGGAKRIHAYARKLEGVKGIATLYKEHDHTQGNKHDTYELIGNDTLVEDSDAVIIDDMVDTLGSMCNGAKRLKEMGARSITVVATHGIFSVDEAKGINALRNLDNSPIDRVIVTNTVQQREDVANHPRIQIVDVAPLFAEAIRRDATGQSLSALFS